MRWAPLLVLLLLAGCLQQDAPQAPVPTATYAPPPSYPFTIRFTRETADGTPLPDAEVYLVPKEEASGDPGKLPPPRFADDRGLVSVTYSKPTTLLVQAFGPGTKGGGWTREGMTVEVGADVTNDRGLRVEGRTVTLPLLRAELPFAVNVTWTGPDRTEAVVPVPPAYATRLASARMELAWTQNADAFGDLYAGLARGTDLVAGEDERQIPVPGSPAKEQVEGAPKGDGPLRAVALTDGVVQGKVALHFSGKLRFDGDWPRELPLPSCFAAEACVPLPTPL